MDTRIWSGVEARSDTEHSLFGHDSPDVNVLHEVLVLFLLPADDTVEGLCPASSEQKGIKKSWSEGQTALVKKRFPLCFPVDGSRAAIGQMCTMVSLLM